MDLTTFFNPSSIAVVGVSSNEAKLGSLIFKNIIKANYQGDLYAINPNNQNELFGKPCFSNLRLCPKALDLVVIAVPARFVSNVIDDAIYNGTKNISIITAGFGEVGNHELENIIADKCYKNNINVLGPNCLGHISTFTNLNASFADAFPKKGNIAFISQSGAYCCAILDWAKNKNIGFSHFISIGNKMLLSETDLLREINKDPNTRAFVFYLESLKQGLDFLNLAREISKTKPVIILEPGKSSKAQAASLSHTGSLAPNYEVMERAFKNNGIIQVYTSGEMFGLIEILQYANHRNFGDKFAILTNAGGLGVVTSDSCAKYGLDLDNPSDVLKEKLKQAVTPEASLKNPIDIIGDARADRYEKALRILCESKEFKNILVLLTPQMATEPLETAMAITKLSKEFKDINIFTSFVGGYSVAQAIKTFEENHILHFDDPDMLINLVSKLNKLSSHKERTVNLKTETKKNKEIEILIREAIKDNLSSLPQSITQKIMEHYQLDYPKSSDFINKAQALNFCEKIFPRPLVLKIAAPEALHKTEMNGIRLNIDNTEKFSKAWDELTDIISKFKLTKASILIQEMITNATEAIIGVNTDKTFGKIMIFGSGGIYTEILHDTTLRLLPTEEFSQMFDETKIGTILRGVRGKKPKALDKVISALEGIQQLVLDFPEIKSIDINPILVTDDRAVIVDFKIIIK